MSITNNTVWHGMSHEYIHISCDRYFLLTTVFSWFQISGLHKHWELIKIITFNLVCAKFRQLESLVSHSKSSCFRFLYLPQCLHPAPSLLPPILNCTKSLVGAPSLFIPFISTTAIVWAKDLIIHIWWLNMVCYFKSNVWWLNKKKKLQTWKGLKEIYFLCIFQQITTQKI